MPDPLIKVARTSVKVNSLCASCMKLTLSFLRIIRSNIEPFVHGLCFSTVIYAISLNTISPLSVSGSSMSPLLNPPDQSQYGPSGDWCIQNSTRSMIRWLRYVPKRGDVVTARSPDKMNASVIKRIIGLEGDFIKCVDGDIIQIPRGYCWLEGDNRPRSIDSNSYGPIPINLIEGRALAVIIPKKFDWSRFFMPLLNEDRPERRTGFEEYIVHKELRESQFFERGLYNERMKWEIENAHKIHRIPPETLKLVLHQFDLPSSVSHSMEHLINEDHSYKSNLEKIKIMKKWEAD